MTVRTADAEWTGGLMDGKGEMELGSGAFQGPFSFKSRMEEGTGTNPEELLGAAHAGCFSMQFSAMLEHAGFPPDKVHTAAKVYFGPVDGGFAITKIELTTEGTCSRHGRCSVSGTGRRPRKQAARCLKPSPGPRLP